MAESKGAKPRFKVIEKGAQRVALMEMNPNFTFFVEDTETRAFQHFKSRSAARKWAAEKNGEISNTTQAAALGQ